MFQTTDRNGELIKNTIIFAIGTVGTKAILFFMVPVYSTFLNASQFGEADLIISTVNVLYPIFSLGIDQAIIRFGLTKTSEKESVLKVSVDICILGGCILMIFMCFLRKIEFIEKYKFLIVFIYFSMAFMSVLTNYCKAQEKNKLFALNSILNALILCSLNIILLVWLNQGIAGYIGAYLGAQIFSICFLCIKCHCINNYRNASKDIVLKKDMIKYSLPLVPNLLSWWIIQMSDRYMLAYYCGTSINGLYTMAYKIPSVFNLIVGIFMQAFNITVYKEIDKGIDQRYIEKMYKHFVCVTFIGGSIAILFTKTISDIVLKKEFGAAWVYVPLLLFSYIISNLQSFYGVLYGGFKANNISFKTTVAGAIVNVGLNFLLIPKMNAYGAAFSTIISYMVVYLFRMVKIKRFLVIDNELKRICISLLLITIQIVFCLKNTALWKMAEICICLLITFVFRKELKMLIDQTKKKMTKI